MLRLGPISKAVIDGREKSALPTHTLNPQNIGRLKVANVEYLIGSNVQAFRRTLEHGRLWLGHAHLIGESHRTEVRCETVAFEQDTERSCRADTRVGDHTG